MMYDMIGVKINNEMLYARPFEWTDNVPTKYMLTCPECAQLLTLEDDDLFKEKDNFIFKLSEEKFKAHNNKCPLRKNSKYVLSKNDNPTLKKILEEVELEEEVDVEEELDNEHLHILSEITTVKRMLDETPLEEVIDRGSMICRLAILDEECEQFKNNDEFVLDVNEDLQKIIDENVEIVYGNK